MARSPESTIARYFFKVITLVAVFCVCWKMLVSRVESRFVQDRIASADASQARAKFDSLLSRDLDAMRLLAYEYGIWDETYAFAESRDPEFIDANVLPIGDNPAQIDFYAFWDASGNALASRRIATARDLDGSELSQLHEMASALVLGHPDRPSAHTAIIGGEVYLVGLTPILRNDGSGPARGVLMFARPLSDSLLDSYKTLIDGQLRSTIHDRTSIAPVALGPARDEGFADWRSGTRSVGTLFIERDSGLTDQLEVVETVQLLTNSLGTAILLAIGALLVRRQILVPLADLKEQLQLRSSKSSERPVTVRSSLREIEIVADGINSLIEAQSRTHAAQRDRDAAQSADRLKSMFLATMSHEIRTPLTGLVGALELASDAHSSAEREQFLNIARISSEHLMQLLDDVLDFSRIEADQLILHTKDVSIQDVIDDAISLMRPRATAKALAIRADLGAPLMTTTDPLRLRQILVNLLSNAIKFSGQGSIDVATRRTGDGVEISVADRGSGVPPDKLESIFDAFRQLRSDLSRRQPGTGLGLAISRRLARALGGDLVARNRAGGGSVFALTLPDVREAAAATEPDGADIPAELAALRGKYILLVDDDESIRAIIASSLSGLGATVVEAVDGASALKLAQDRHFDLILMDRHMPGIDGLDTARALRAPSSPNQQTPIFAMTASTQVEDQRACLEAGMTRFVGKPIKLIELARLIAREIG